jgi:hypothetical protein
MMNSKGLSLASMLLVAAGGLYGCADGDEAIVNITTAPGSDSGGSNPGGGVSLNCPSWSLARQQDADGNDVCQMPDSIMEDRTVTADVTWYIDDNVVVGNGGGFMSDVEGVLANGDTVVEATLTIEAGVAVKAEADGAIIVTRGSNIEALGTADAPIIFSSTDDGYDGSGEWGGLVIHGYAPSNVNAACNPGSGLACNYEAEGGNGGSFQAGGHSPDDDSGTLRYVVVAEGGLIVAANNEINGISLASVGSGTEIDYVQVHNNLDDGIEFFGGNVNAKHLVLTGNEDDTVDWDEGYQGNLQFILALQSDASSGTAIEADTEGASGATYLSKPAIANATFVGAGTGSPGNLLVFKANSGGFLLHSVLTFDSSVTVATTCVGAGATTQQTAGALAFNNVVADCDTVGDATLDGQTTLIGDVMLSANWSATASEASSVGDLSISDFNTTYAESVADETFFDVTDYAGAVDPNQTSDFWWEGWTLLGTL